MSSTVVVLGGCGAVGSVAVRTLAASGAFDRIVAADMALERMQALAAEIGAPVEAVAVDAGDAASIRSVIAGADIVLNCVGPFYKTVKIVLDAVLSEGIDYVDICDDVDVTLEILAMDARAKEAGVRALIGMGASPGATNLLARFVADNLLDECDSIDIFHTHGGEPTEGAGVIGHRFHCMSIDITMYLDGELRHVRYFDEDGIPLFPYPHPEQVTLPNYIPCRRVTNKGSVLPIEYYRLTAEMCRLGLASREPIRVGDREVVPYDFAVAWIVRERERILRETDFGTQRGCMSVVVAGTKDGERHEYRVHLSSSSRALGEGTGVPAAMGVLLMQQGKVTATGVLPPEAAVAPMDFITLWRSMEAAGGHTEADGGSTILVEHVGPDGHVDTLDL
jgi:saccharopine dehydrogenase (NAD+, L-lysine-forming)